MGIFRRKEPGGVLFLMPVNLADEKLPRRKVRMLYADTAGKVYASIVNRSVYDLAQKTADVMEQRQTPYAIVGLETGPGKFVPTAVVINHNEFWALENISEHALKTGRLPDILKKYIGPIIGMGEAQRDAALLEERERRRSKRTTTPRVMERLPYYLEKDIEFSMPIYKASHSYPLIALKPLPPGEGTPDTGRLLVLDNDGDLGVIKIPAALVNKMERNLRELRKGKGSDFCTIISQDERGMAIDYISLSRQQRTALDTIMRYFEETGSGKQPISLAAKAVLSKARDRLVAPVK